MSAEAHCQERPARRSGIEEEALRPSVPLLATGSPRCRTTETDRPSAAVFLIGHLAADPLRGPAVGDREVSHRSVGCGAMPVQLACRRMHRISRPGLDPLSAIDLHQRSALQHVDHLARRVGMPVGPSSRVERHAEHVEIIIVLRYVLPSKASHTGKPFLWRPNPLQILTPLKLHVPPRSNGADGTRLRPATDALVAGRDDADPAANLTAAFRSSCARADSTWKSHP